MYKSKKVFIVAEVSANHNGSLAHIKKLILAAKRSGADAVKIQSYDAEAMTINTNKKDFLIDRNNPWEKYKNLWNLYSTGETPYNWHEKIFKYAKKIKIPIFSSPFSIKFIELLEKLNCPIYKVASPEINHFELLKRIAKTKKPVILSTGVATMKDIDNAIEVLKKYKSGSISILKCVTSYPSPTKELNLNSIKTLISKYPYRIGFSDHSISHLPGIAAVALGATILERHLTLNHKNIALDSFFSSDFNDFKKYVKAIRDCELSLGVNELKLTKSSKKSIKFKRSIYCSKEIKKGEIFSDNNISIVRPAFGLNPKYYGKILNKPAKKKYNKGDRISQIELS